MGFLFRCSSSGAINIIKVVLLITTLAIALLGCGQGDMQTVVIDGDDMHVEDDTAEYIYGIAMDEDAGVISQNVADVYVSPDVKSDRISQALYNQPVSILSKESGWAKVKIVDGSTGWIKSKYIDSDISSIYGRNYTRRIVVTSREKTIYAYPAGGNTRMIAPMGTELYAFGNIDDSYEVYLPGNKTGWLQGSGIIHIGLNGMIPVTNAEDFASTALRLKGVSYLLNGMSASGIDAPGLVYICARINGINLPLMINGQLASGTEIKPEEALAGDLVFLSDTGESEPEQISSSGICIGGGNYIFASRKAGYVTIGEINRKNADGIVIAARRIFNKTSE